MKILIVEDDTIQAEAVKSQLIELGHQPLEPVGTGEGAIAVVKKTDLDLVLMDIDLPGMINGIETTEIINKIKTGLPVIYLTILEEEAIFRSIQETAHLYFLPKPFNLSQLNKALKYVEAKIKEKPGQEEPLLDEHIFLKKNDLQYDRIPVGDILWVEGGRNNITVVTKNNGKYVISGVFATFSEKVNQPSLKRVHRSYMINLKQVTAIKGRYLMVGENEIPYTKTYVANINELLRVISSSK
ncbi:MAG: response regulator transcription factor [Bacteroidota bacterium]